MFSARIAGGLGLQAVANDLKRAGGQLRPKLAKELREPTKEIYKAVEHRVLTGSMRARSVPGAERGVPGRLGRGNHVRRPVLRGLSWKVSTSSAGPRAEVDWQPSKIEPRVRPLFAYLVRQRKRLRHPIFGKTADGKWRGGVSQSMPDAWAPVRKLLPAAQEAAGKALDHTAAIIAGRR